MKKLSEHINRFLKCEIDPGFARRARIILSQLNPKLGMKILDVGCGRGFYEAAVASVYPGVKITGIDAGTDYIEIAKKAIKYLPGSDNINFLQADARHLPFPEGSFDRIICSDVLEHVNDDSSVVREIFRVLKKNGRAIFTVPVKNYPFMWDPTNFMLELLLNIHLPSKIWWLSGIWADHVRLYEENKLKSEVEDNGLTIINLWRATTYCFPFSHFILYGIGKNLVEWGIVQNSFNRFTYNRKPSVAVKAIKGLFGLFDRFNSDSPDQKLHAYLNLIVLVQKK